MPTLTTRSSSLSRFVRRTALVLGLATAALVAAPSTAHADVWGSVYWYNTHQVTQQGWNGQQLCLYNMWYDDYGNWGYNSVFCW